MENVADDAPALLNIVDSPQQPLDDLPQSPNRRHVKKVGSMTPDASCSIEQDARGRRSGPWRVLVLVQCEPVERILKLVRRQRIEEGRQLGLIVQIGDEVRYDARRQNSARERLLEIETEDSRMRDPTMAPPLLHLPPSEADVSTQTLRCRKEMLVQSLDRFSVPSSKAEERIVLLLKLLLLLSVLAELRAGEEIYGSRHGV